MSAPVARMIRLAWGRRVRSLLAALLAAMIGGATGRAQSGPEQGVRLDAGRFTIVSTAADARLARALLESAQARDTFPGLARPKARVLIAIAGSPAQFRAWVGPHAPEWGAAIAIPDEQRIVMQGRFAGSDAGDPRIVLRHELAHLALHEHLGRLPSRWFDEGYASVSAGEWTRDQLFETSLGMVWRSLPTLDALDAGFRGGGVEAGWHYALAHRVVAELDALSGPAGMAPFLSYWRETGSFEKALRFAYGLTGEAFEKHWRRETRRRYGALAMVTDVSLAVGLFSLILAPVFVNKRRRDRQRLEDLRAADARQDAEARASALQAMLDQ